MNKERMMKQFLVGLLTSTVAVFAPIQPILLTVGVVIFADLVTGIWAAHKRGEGINSAGIRRTISKIFVYQTAVMVGFLIETFLLHGTIPISKIASALIGTTEGLSIFENLNSISGNNIFKAILTKLGSVNDKKKD